MTARQAFYYNRIISAMSQMKKLWSRTKIKTIILRVVEISLLVAEDTISLKVPQECFTNTKHDI